MSPTVATYPSLEDWIRRDAIPFAVDSPETFDPAVDRIMASLGDAVKLLGFGEALHGGEDILILRNRLFQRLVEAHGYSAIAVESSYPRGRLVNDYIAGRGPASFDAVREAGFSHGFGRLAANRELVEWMRAYNADPAHVAKLHFYGFDGPMEMSGAESPRQLLRFALDYLALIDRGGAETRQRRIDELLGNDADWENPAAAFDPTEAIGSSPAVAALRIETEELITELGMRRPELIAVGDEQRYGEAVHDASLARQLLTYHAGMARPSDNRIAELLGIRDLMMADNLAYALSRERAHTADAGKVLAFAHNSHLKRGRAHWQLGPHALAWWPAGAHVGAMLGARYAVIGSAVGMSPDNGIGRPEPGTLEAALTAAPGPARFVPTCRGQGFAAEALADVPVRSASVRNQGYFPLTAQSFTDFDWLVALDSTTYARGGPPLP